MISDDPRHNRGSLTPGRSVATLEIVDKTMELKFERIICSSSIQDLDASILAFDDSTQTELQKHRDSICSYPIANPPAPDGKQRVYIIGHPNGGILQISLQDNIFLACNDRFMQYRTPTEHGSSGSPVFNENWELIGIHHAGGDNMPLLNLPGCTGKANEGILISAILQNCPGTAAPAHPQKPAAVQSSCRKRGFFPYSALANRRNFSSVRSIHQPLKNYLLLWLQHPKRRHQNRSCS